MKPIALLLFTTTMWAQQPSGPAGTKGTCSPAVTGSNNTFKLTCTGLTSAQQELLKNIPLILNKLLAMQADNTTEIISKLDTCIAQGARAIDKLADRTLTDEQIGRIVTKLKGFSGQKFDVTAYWDSPESMSITNQLYGVLLVAGWKYIKPENGAMLLGGVVGVMVWFHPDADASTKNAAAELVAALTKEGIAAVPKLQNPVNNPKHNMISLSIGSKM